VEERAVELDSPVLVWGTGAVAVALAALVVVGWRRLAGRSPLAVLARAGALVSVNVLVLLAVGLVANDQFGFFAGWRDLLGSTGATTTIRTGGAAAADRTRWAPGDRAPGGVVGRQVAGYEGRVWEVQVPGPRSGLTASALLVLPPGYTSAAAAHTTYPVLEAFHGWPGTPGQWLDAMGLLPSVDAAVAQHHLAQPLVVIPALEVPAGRDTECVDGAAGQPQLETWLTQDVPQFLTAHYRVRAGRSAWATTGLSMGGWCANMAAMLHPQQYGAALSFGGYFALDLGRWKPWPAGSPQARRYDLVSLAQHDPPPVALWATSSPTDGLSWPSTRTVASEAGGGLTMTLVAQPHAGHRTSVWAGQLPTALAWLGTTEAGFSPGA